MPPVNNPPSGVPAAQPTIPNAPPVQVPGQQVFYYPVIRSTEMLARQSMVFLHPVGQQVLIQPTRPAARSMDAVDPRSLNYGIHPHGPPGATGGARPRTGQWVFMQSQVADPTAAVQSAG